MVGIVGLLGFIVVQTVRAGSDNLFRRPAAQEQVITH